MILMNIIEIQNLLSIFSHCITHIIANIVHLSVQTRTALMGLTPTPPPNQCFIELIKI